MTPPLTEQLHRDAYRVLDEANAGTPRALLLWAVGALEIGDAVWLAHLPPQPQQFAPVYAAVTLAGGRLYEANRQGWRIRHGRQPVAAGNWDEVVQQLRPHLVGEEMRTRVRVAVQQRRERRPGAAEACLELGTRVWRLAQPDTGGGQASLLAS